MYLDDKLKILCQDDVKRLDKYSQWQVIRQEVVNKLNTVCTYFPHFSKHDSSHSETIEEQIGNLLGNDRIDKLSCSDIIIMIAVFYLHDVGMALEYEDIYEKFTSKYFQEKLEELSNDSDSELQMVAKRLKAFSSVNMCYEYSIDVYNDVIEIIETLYRSKHAERSATLITGHAGINRCFGTRCQNILAKICNLHQKPISNIMELPYKENGLFGDFFHPRFIAAMLCLGDLMDLDTERFDETSLKAASPMPHLSKIHMQKHESIEHYLVEKNEIKITSNTKNILVYNAMRQWLDWMQDTCEYVSLHWSEIAPVDFGNAPRLVERKLFLNGELISNELANLHYQISGKRMYRLMQGGGLYRNKLVCIREIIQNAVDATIYRLFDEEILKGDTEEVLKAGNCLPWEQYKVEGDIEKVDNTKVKIRVRDRGIGVSEEDLHRIARVSNEKSKQKKELLKRMPEWIRPSGAFGIGLQSIFLLTDEFTMITKTINEPPKKIVFQSASNGTGFIIVKKYYERFTQGTEVTFTVDVTKMSAEELHCSNYHYKNNFLSDYFLNRMIIDYDNQYTAIPPARNIRKKKVDSVPLDISIIDHTNNKPRKLINVNAFLSFNEKEIEICDGFVKTQFFFPKLNCHLACDINLENNQNHTYGKFERRFSYLNNAVFYRHEFVLDDCLERSVLENISLFPYVDWRIDLMEGDTEKILNLNRNTIREEYSQHFLYILLNALKGTVCKVIDYLLENYEKERKNIGDTILLFYQFSKQYDYKCSELREAFKDVLDQIIIGNYVKFGREESFEIRFDCLENTTIYFIGNELVEDSIIPNIIKDTSDLNSKDKMLFYLNKSDGIHILNHRAQKAYIAKLEGKYFEVIEAIPFECLNPMKLAIDMDNIIFRNKILRMLRLRIRGLPVLKGYENLATPINPECFSIRHYMSTETYLIELPFGVFQEMLYQELNTTGFVSKAYDKYFVKIVDSELYKSNLDYIKSYHETNIASIECTYRQFIERILNVLADESFKDFNKKILSQYPDPRTSEYVFNGRDELESNSYLSMTIFQNK